MSLLALISHFWLDILLTTVSVGALTLLLIAGVRYRRHLERIQRAKQEERDRFERKLSTLLGNMPGIAYRCHNDGGDWVMEYVSEGSLELTGYTREELESGEYPVFGDLIHPEDRERVVKAVEDANRLGERYRVQYRIIRRDGGELWVWEQGVLVDPQINNGMLEGFICDITESKDLEVEKDRAIGELEKALREIRRLRGILPICSSCKKIRNDDGAWEQMEVYIRERSEAEFSHGICPDCAGRLYPGARLK